MVKEIFQQQHRKRQEQQALLKSLLPHSMVSRVSRNEIVIEILTKKRSKSIEYKKIDNKIEYNDAKMSRIK